MLGLFYEMKFILSDGCENRLLHLFMIVIDIFSKGYKP